MKRLFYLLMIIVLALAILIPNAAFATQRIKWGSTSVRSDGYAMVVQYADSVRKAFPDIDITVVETGGFIENLARLQKNLLDIGSSNPVFAYYSYMGTGKYEGNANPRLRTIWSTATKPQNFMVGKNSGIVSLEDLDGAKMAFNPLSSSETLAMMFLEANNITPKKVQAGTGANLEAMKAGNVNAWVRAGFNVGSISELAIARELNFLSITEEHLKKYNDKYPGQGVGIAAPAGQYKGQDEPFYTLAFVYGDLADKDVPEDVVYKIVKANWENRENTIKVNAGLRKGGFANFAELTLKSSIVPLHPGTVKFLREMNLEIPENLIPPELK